MLTTEQSNLLIEKLQEQVGFSHQNWQLLLEDTNSEVAASMLEKYIESLSQANHQIQNMNLKDDSEFILRIVHKLSSTSELIGFLSLAKKCRNLQKIIKENSFDQNTENLLADIKIEITSILTSVKHLTAQSQIFPEK